MQKIFLAFFYYSSTPLHQPPPFLLVCQWRGERWYRPQCKQTHRAAMMLIMFPKHILGPYPHCRELSIYPFLFPYCTAWNIYDGIWGAVDYGKKRGLQLELVFSKKRNLCHVRCSNAPWHRLLKGIPVPRWESVVCVIWRANIVNQPL